MKWYDWILLIVVIVLLVFSLCGSCYAIRTDQNWKGETEYYDDSGNLIVVHVHSGNHPSDIKSRWFLPDGREVEPRAVRDWDGELIDIKWQYTGSRREPDRRFP